MNDPEYKGKRAWRVNFALPKNEERKWIQNHQKLVVAHSIEEAINKVMSLSPEAVIWQVNHQGIIEV